MTALKYCTASTVEGLRKAAADQLDWYYAPERGTPPPELTVPNAARESSCLHAPDLAGGLVLPAAGAPLGKADARNALHVYRQLSELTPRQAADERLWVWLCHMECPAYVARRWLDKRPDQVDDAVTKVNNHFFASGNRGVIRDNGVSRLWWLGFIAHQAAPEDPGGFLEMLLHRQDVRSSLIERPSVSMNRTVLRGIGQVMRQHWLRDGRPLFRRDSFREWMKNLNRRGGVLLLDTLSPEQLSHLLTKEADAALVQPEHG